MLLPLNYHGRAESGCTSSLIVLLLGSALLVRSSPLSLATRRWGRTNPKLGRMLRYPTSVAVAPSLQIYTHEGCLKHKVMFHPESPERLRYLMEDIIPTLSSRLSFDVISPNRLPTKEDLQLIHTPDYVESTFEAFRQVRDGHAVSVFLDSDTQVVEGTEESAMRGAGVTLQAVEDVVEGKALRAFVMVRPPGHHAEPNTAMGFCVFNNIMLGLAHAQRKYHKLIKRVALLDFDVHHGNGGQAACWEHPSRFFASTHQTPLFPWKGLSTDTGVQMNVVNVPLSKESTSQEFRDAWEHKILPSVRKYQPDMIFVSAGFDAHEDDPLASLNLVEDDFHFLTDKIARLANEVSNGRLVTVLEGGYDPDALGRCVTAHIEALAEAPLPSEAQLKGETRSTDDRSLKVSMLFSREEIEAMDKSTIRAELAKLGLPTSGRLDSLKDRLGAVVSERYL